MASLGDFNANDHQTEEREFLPIPEGQYMAEIESSEMRRTKAGNGEYLQLRFVILGGEYQGRKLWSRLNIENPNTITKKIARGELASICRAANVLVPADSSELHGKPMIITVKIRSGEGGAANEIKNYTKYVSLSALASSLTSALHPPSVPATSSAAIPSVPPSWRLMK